MKLKNNKIVNRLYNEWVKHNGIIIGLDFDDTIFPYRHNFTNTERVIKLIKKAIKYKAKIIINSASIPSRYDFIKKYCIEKGINIQCINENIIVPFGDNRKIYANLYIDDRAGLKESLKILKKVLKKLKYENNFLK